MDNDNTTNPDQAQRLNAESTEARLESEAVNEETPELSKVIEDSSNFNPDTAASAPQCNEPGSKEEESAADDASANIKLSSESKIDATTDQMTEQEEAKTATTMDNVEPKGVGSEPESERSTSATKPQSLPSLPLSQPLQSETDVSLSPPAPEKEAEIISTDVKTPEQLNPLYQPQAAAAASKGQIKDETSSNYSSKSSFSKKNAVTPFVYDPHKITVKFLFANRDGLHVTLEFDAEDSVGEVKGALMSVWPDGTLVPVI